MPNSYILTPQTYLYAFINKSDGNFQSGSSNQNAELAINETIVTYCEGNPSILKSGDKLIVQGTEIEESHWPELIKSFYDIGWHRGVKVYHIGVNSEGNPILVHYAGEEKSTIKLSCLKFEWSRYGVIVPNDDMKHHDELVEVLQGALHLLQEKDKKLEEKESEITKIEVQLTNFEKRLDVKGDCIRLKEAEIQNLKQQNGKLGHMLAEKDRMVYEKEAKIKELKQQNDILRQQKLNMVNENDDYVVRLQRALHLVEDKEAEIKKLKQQNDNLQQQHDKMDIQTEKLRVRIPVEDHEDYAGQQQKAQHLLEDKEAKIKKLKQLLENRDQSQLKGNERCRSYDMPPDRFVISYQPLIKTSSKTTYCPQLHIPIEKLRVFVPLDHEMADCSTFPDKICVYTCDDGFHNKEWQLIKAADSLTTTMLGFYDGDFDQVSIHGNLVYIPFHRGQTFRSNTHEFFIGLICGIGLRFMFLY